MEDILEGKRILVVDDEVDIVESLKEIFDMCEVDIATSYDEAKDLLLKNRYDATVLDIMGVKGMELLEIATKRKIPSLMLTAHGMSLDALSNSLKMGAKMFIPKDRMHEIDQYVRELLVAKEKGMDIPVEWFKRLSAFFESRFGKDWKERDREFWEEFEKKIYLSQEEDETEK